jgi:ABC-type sugar transport system permease subunit
VRLTRTAKEHYKTAFLLSLPALIGLILFHYWPIYEMVRISLLDYKIFTGEFSWIGAENYGLAFEDALLFETLKTTVLFFLLKVPLQMALALALAMFMTQGGRSIGFLRTVVLLPAVTAMVVASTVWGFMFHPDNGLVNSLLLTAGLSPQPFLASAQQALPSIAFITIWKQVGLNMLFFMAGLLTIPGVYYEAAKVDGATAWQTFRNVTLPLLTPTTIFVLITSTIATFKVFVPVKVLTDGGPSGATRVIVLYIFELAFRFSRLGYAAAISVLLALILLVLSIVQMRMTREG